MAMRSPRLSVDGSVSYSICLKRRSPAILSVMDQIGSSIFRPDHLPSTSNTAMHLETLDARKRHTLAAQARAIGARYYLAGGTALALRLGYPRR